MTEKPGIEWAAAAAGCLSPHLASTRPDCLPAGSVRALQPQPASPLPSQALGLKLWVMSSCFGFLLPSEDYLLPGWLFLGPKQDFLHQKVEGGCSFSQQ